MNTFKILFCVINNYFITFDILVGNIYLFWWWFLLSFMFLVIFVFFGFSWLFIFFELLFVSVCFIFSFKYIEIYNPLILVRHTNSYFEILSNYFNSKFDSRFKSEDFFPPFTFGYRKYFFARIVGWKGTWASYLKYHKRRIRSSVFEWGYKGKNPSWHAYLIRGKRHAPIVVPNNFRRVFNTSYKGPSWFYSFPVELPEIGFSDDEWEEYNYEAFLEKGHEDLNMIYNRYAMPRVRYMYLSSWVEKWAPSLSSRYTKASYFNSINPSSPYSYSNFPISFLNTSKIMTTRRPPGMGFQTEILYQDVEAQEAVNPRIVPIVKKMLGKNPSFERWTAVQHYLTTIGESDKYLIDVEALQVKVLKIKYIFYGIKPARTYDDKFNSVDFIRLSWYHTFIEFCSLLFESFYIYPFEVKVVDRWVRIDFNSFVEGFLTWDIDMFLRFESFTIILIYILCVVLYFFLCISSIQVFNFFSNNVKINWILQYFTKFR